MGGHWVSAEKGPTTILGANDLIGDGDTAPSMTPFTLHARAGASAAECDYK